MESTWAMENISSSKSEIIGTFENATKVENGVDDKEFPDRHPDASTFALALLMLSFACFGVFGNVMSILVFTRRSMRSSINVLLTGLSVVDLSVLTLAILVYVIPGLSVYSQHLGHMDIWNLVIVFGLYQGSLIAQTCSIWTFVLISLERFLAVCRPFQAQRVLTITRARYAQLGVAVFAASYNFVRFWEYSLVSKNTTIQGDESLGYERLLRDNYFYFIGYYTISYVVVHFFAPFLLITVLNWHIIKTVADASALRQTLAPKRKTSQNPCNYNNGSNSTSLQPYTAVLKDAKRQGKITRMIVVVTLIFFFCNTLPFVLNIWEAFETTLFADENPRSVVAYIILDISNILVVLNSSTNFVVYAIYCRQYRRLCRRYLRRLCGCDPWIDPNDNDNLFQRKSGNGYFESLSDMSKLTASAPPTTIIRDGSNTNNNNNCLKAIVKRDYETRSRSSLCIVYTARKRATSSRVSLF